MQQEGPWKLLFHAGSGENLGGEGGGGGAWCAEYIADCQCNCAAKCACGETAGGTNRSVKVPNSDLIVCSHQGAAMHHVQRQARSLISHLHHADGRAEPGDSRGT